MQATGVSARAIIKPFQPPPEALVVESEPRGREMQGELPDLGPVAGINDAGRFQSGRGAALAQLFRRVVAQVPDPTIVPLIDLAERKRHPLDAGGDGEG